LKQYQDVKDYDSMIEIAKKMREMGTNAGQTIQAFNIMQRLTPEGMVKYAQSELSEAFDRMSKNQTKKWIDSNRSKFDLTTEEVQFIIDTMNEVQTMNDGYDKKVKLAQIQKLMTDKLPPSKGAGIRSWMRISMLFNPKTQVRNVVGNAAIMPVNAISDIVSSYADKVISKKTGVRTSGNINVKAMIKGFKEGAYQATNDYKKGITPNPCVLCNKYIKFGLMYDELLKYGADYIATGHYALIKDGKLYKASDKNKDQSYFIYNLKKEQLPKILFPLYNYTKADVRKIALEYKLPTATKKESTDVCFIGKNGFKEYLKENAKGVPGNIVNIETNEIIGTHNGLMYYTLGQRRGLNIGGTKDRLFVAKKDINKNILYVAIGDENNYLTSTSCILEDINLLSKLPEKATAKFRYRQEDNEVFLSKLEDGILVKYPNGVKSVTPGQACVLYDGDECIGGGIIKTVN